MTTMRTRARREAVLNRVLGGAGCLIALGLAALCLVLVVSRRMLTAPAPGLPTSLPPTVLATLFPTPALSTPAAAAAHCTPVSAAAPAAHVYLRVNQVGYLPSESKLALALTNESLDSQDFNVIVDADSRAVFTGVLGVDRGPYGNFAHLYELDFGGLTAPGAYRVTLGTDSSPCFVISQSAYAAVIPVSLQFFRVQRCGDTDPLLHKACHREDGIAKGGPLDGKHIDATGGWHDAGDYLKFLQTAGYATNLMLTAYQRHPRSFADDDANGTPDVLDEARIGLSWMLKMWDPGHDVLYYQVGDVSDHNAGWRMPEGDDINFPPRLVWACDPGKGANVAGQAAAALALAASLRGDTSASFYDPPLASTYLTAARQLYDYGKARPAAQSATGDPSVGGSFYADDSWQDDLALAAAELFRATGEEAYLREARVYAAADADEGRPFDWAEVGPLARYEIARLDPTYTPKAASLLADDLSGYQAHAGSDPFRVAAAYGWGSAEQIIGAALTALWREDLTGDAADHRLAVAQRDYLLGGNPWGVSFVNSIGSNWPHHPHHGVAFLTGSELVGFWDEGPVTRADFLAQNITLHDADTYAAFQSEAAVYHDDVEDYVTNEPTIDVNAMGLALVAWFAPPRP